jgi:hypothetical protein
MAKKYGPIKLPKRIAGVKVPKAVRKGVLGDFLRSKAGQAMIAEAVMAISTAILAKQQAEPGSTARRAGKGAKEAAQSAKAVVDSAGEGAASLAPTTVAFAFAEAGRAFAEALKGRSGGGGGEAEPPDADWPADFEAPSTQDSAKSSKAEAAPAPAKPH